MAQFRVGQRVRVVGLPARDRYDLDWIVGREAVIKEQGVAFDWRVRVDGLGQHLDANGVACGDLVPLNSEHLAPLTDPDGERFVESLKRLAREPQGVPQKEVV